MEYIETFVFENDKLMVRVLGPQAKFMDILSKELMVQLGSRGEELTFSGNKVVVKNGIRILSQLCKVCKAGKSLTHRDIKRGVKILNENPHADLDEIFNDVVHVTASKRLITPRGLAQKEYVDTIRGKDLTFGIGPAGTGKTYLAVAVAVSELLAGRYKKIILTRPAVEAGEKLGFLPGDMVEKINPYVRPLYDALNDMMDMAKTQELISIGQIEIAPLAFMRGRTLNDSFVILDEAQNTTSAQMKMFLTRLGYSSKAVVTGDITQIDLPPRVSSGLMDAQYVLRDVKDIGFCKFTAIDVVRHKLVQQIIDAYDNIENNVSNNINNSANILKEEGKNGEN